MQEGTWKAAGQAGWRARGRGFLGLGLVDPARRAGLHLDREDRLAALPRLHQLRKTPFGGEPTGRQQRNDRLARAQLLIERLLPTAAAFDPRLRV